MLNWGEFCLNSQIFGGTSRPSEHQAIPRAIVATGKELSNIVAISSRSVKRFNWFKVKRQKSSSVINMLKCFSLRFRITELDSWSPSKISCVLCIVGKQNLLLGQLCESCCPGECNLYYNHNIIVPSCRWIFCQRLILTSENYKNKNLQLKIVLNSLKSKQFSRVIAFYYAKCNK